MTTVQPYPAGTVWDFQHRKTGYPHAFELALSWQPDYHHITDDFRPAQKGARALWDAWVAEVGGHLHNLDPQRYRPGDVRITWTVTTPSETGVAEYAPFSDARLHRPVHGPWEDFLTHFTWPTQAATGERLNWARLPVLDRGWNADRGDKGGFIQELLGWKPAPLQPVMNVYQLAQAAGLDG